MLGRRSLYAVLLILALAVLWHYAAPLLHAQSFPTSVGLLYFPKKNFKAGDWVLYEVRDADFWGEEHLVYQKVQVAKELRYRGEDCFWLETGLGHDADELTFSAVLVSEGIFDDEMPEVRHTYYVRKMHIGNDENGVPLSMDMRVMSSSDTLVDLSYRRPKVEFAGMDTLVVGQRSLICSLRVETQDYATLRDLPDSTIRTTTKVVRRRWICPEVPVTGLVREREDRQIHRQSWPLGKVSTDFPPLLRDHLEIDIDMVDFGDGAKPEIADRIQDSANPHRGN